MNLTNENIRTLSTQENRKIFWDSNNPGFGVRVASSGLKNFVFMYRFKGKCQMLTIGRFPEVKMESALSQVTQFKTKLKNGGDPKDIFLKNYASQKTLGSRPLFKKYLSDEEIEALWKGINNLDHSIHMKSALSLLLFYGQTKRNILQTQWQHLDFETGIWVIPQSLKDKTQFNFLPLLNNGKFLFQRLPRISKWVFPSSRQQKPISEASIDQAIRDIRSSFNIVGLTVTNVRRTIAANMITYGYHPYVIKEILGFKTPKDHQFSEISKLDQLNNIKESSFHQNMGTIGLKSSVYGSWHDYLFKVIKNESKYDLEQSSIRALQNEIDFKIGRHSEV